MMKRLFVLLTIWLLTYSVELGANPEPPKEYDDGPYITISNDTLIANWISKGKLQTKVVTGNLEFEESGLPNVHLTSESANFEPSLSVIKTDQPIAAISDIHGQYDVFVKLLKAQNIVDDDLNWSYDKGNLVIVGDVLDRGDKVLDCLWLIYNLEQQAKEAGGAVHYLLGNHELMVMNGNVDYLHKKYFYTSALVQKHYSKLFSNDTFLGSWLANKNVLLKLNDKLFVHGGISRQALSLNLSLDKINTLFKNNIYFKNLKQIEAVPELATLYFDEGPLWYRGYAYPYSFKKVGVDSVLQVFNLNHIIVGHTSLPEIKGLYDNKILLIDSSIKLGETGQMLLFDNEFEIGLIDGTTEKLISEEKKEDSQTIFEYLEDKELVQVILSEGMNDIVKRFNKDESPTFGTLNIIANKEQYIFNAEFILGGKSRRQICMNPPIKINLPKEELANFNFIPEFDKIKIVYQCDAGKTMSESLKLEKFIYDLQGVVTDFSQKTILIRVKTSDQRKLQDGFLLEDRNDMERRVGLKELSTPTFATEILDRKEYLKMCLFQYMIANTDWSARKMHNTRVYQRLEDEAYVTIPYDFDFAGLINNDYAMPSEKLPITKVTQRYFMDKRITRAELDEGIAYFNSIKDDIFKLCNDVEYLSEPSKARVTKFIEAFYAIINNEKQVERMLKK